MKMYAVVINYINSENQIVSYTESIYELESDAKDFINNKFRNPESGIEDSLTINIIEVDVYTHEELFVRKSLTEATRINKKKDFSKHDIYLLFDIRFENNAYEVYRRKEITYNNLLKRFKSDMNHENLNKSFTADYYQLKNFVFVIDDQDYIERLSIENYENKLSSSLEKEHVPYNEESN